MRLVHSVLILCCVCGLGRGIPYLLYANRRDVRLVDAGAPRLNATVVVDHLEDAAAVDFAHAESSVFWTDVSLEAIKRTWLNDSQQLVVDVVTTGLAAPDGLACDWLGKKLYWTDSETNRIECSNFDGSYRKVLFWRDLDQPRAIALDPMHGYLYWTDWGEMPKIERAGMDGSLDTRQVVISDRIYWPNGLTLDYDDSRVYWADAKLHFIHSCNFDGSDRRVIVAGPLPHVFALTLYQSTLYWTDWHTHAIHSCNKNTGKELKEVHSKIYSPMDIHAWSPQRQPITPSPCGKINGGCSHLCLMAPRPPFYACACPTGVQLLADNKTCANGPKEILLLVRRTDIRSISLDTPDYTDVVLDLSDIHHAIAIDYDPVEGHIYWTDDEAGVIKRAYMDGTGEEVIVATEVDHPDGIAVDWVARNLYWTDTGTDRIEVARLNGTSRRVLVSEKLDEPRSIALDPMRGFMYWTDWGEVPKLERAALDGSERQALVNSSLGWPNGLSLDLTEQKVYWGDAKTDKIEVANMDGTGRRTLVSEQLPHIFGFSLLGDYIYWTDWQRRSIERVNKHTGGERSVIIEQLPDLMGLKAVKRVFESTIEDYADNACSKDNGECSHLCLNRPGGQGHVCACPMGLELLDNGKVCIVPEAYLIFTRRDNIRRISLETNHKDTVIPVSGVREASALDFDSNDNRIYWTDISKRSISRAFMNGSALEETIKIGLEYPEGIAVDWVAHNIYWADSGTSRIEMSRLDGSYRKVLVWKDVQSPRAIALDPPEGYMYWTDWSTIAKIERAGLDGSNRTVLVGDIGRANGLTIDYIERRIYWIDLDKRVIQSANLQGEDLRTICKNLEHPFGLTQYQDYVYWTDWSTLSIERANKTTGHNITRIQGDLDYIMGIIVIHASRQSGWNSCGVNNGLCSHVCIAHSEANPSSFTHHCACATHYTLNADNKTCNPPEDFLLFSQRNTISRKLVDDEDSPDMILPIQGLRNIKALAYDPVDKHIYWIDGRTKTIKRATDNGTDAATVVPNPQPQDLFNPYDIDIDPYSRHIYWSDQMNNVINVTRLDFQKIGVVVNGPNQKPRAIALAPRDGYMFWTNLNKPVCIQRAAMDGTSPLKVVTTNLMEPGALTVDHSGQRIYWSDHKLKRIESANFLGGNRRIMVFDNVRTAIGMAVFGPYLYWIDKDQDYIERIDTQDTNRRIQFQKRLQHLSDILSVESITKAELAAHPCSTNNGGCTHLCIKDESEVAGGHRCSCPDTLMLTKDAATCAEPPTCSPEEFTCVSGSIKCIPLVWKCDGQAECKDSSDETDCPSCTVGHFRCKSDGICIKPSQRCDGTAQCKDKSDEMSCPPCMHGQFECRSDKACIDASLRCDSQPHCTDGEDEQHCLGPRTQRHGETATAQYTVGIVVGLIAVMFILIFVVFACRRKNQHLPLDESRDIIMVTKPLNPQVTLPPPPPNNSSAGGTLTSSRGGGSGGVGKSSTTCLTLATSPGMAPLLYDRNHVTGASSSSSMVTHYPKETLNPPPSPVTDRSACMMGDLYYSSNSPSTVRSYSGGRYGRLNTTPCSTDVCEESEPYNCSNSSVSAVRRPHHKKKHRYYNPSLMELPGGGYDSDPFHPPPPTPRSHYLSDEMSCPPSPSTERSYFNPYPPPPSPVGMSDC